MPGTLRRLRPDVADRLRDLPLTYDLVGGSLTGSIPDGFNSLTRRYVLSDGEAAFTAASEGLFAWQVQRGAGLDVVASSPHVEVGAVAIVYLGLRPFALRAPVRVVGVVEETQRRGFAYGTLPGHPEQGEEAFVLELSPVGEVALMITAYSRPATVLSRLGGPVTDVVQSWVTNRYGRALRS